MDLKHQKYELNESMGEDEIIRSLKVGKWIIATYSIDLNLNYKKKTF